MLCTGYNQHIVGLLMNQQVLWKCILDNGMQVFSDFDVPDQKDPWTRLKQYCNNNNVKIVEVKAIVPGNPEALVFQNPEGLDNILLIRGTAKDINDDGETSYSFMTFGKVEDDGKIHVRRYYWPECAFGTYEEIREITPENENLIFRQRKQCGDKCKCQSKEQN